MSDVLVPTQYRVRVKQRLRVLAYAEEHGLKPAARHFALSRTTVREWCDRRDAYGLAGLLPSYPKRRRRRVAPDVVRLVKQARLAHRFGDDRTQIWLHRVHGISLAAQTIQRLFRDLGLNLRAHGSGGPSKCGYSRRTHPAILSRWTSSSCA